ncbi:MAG: flavodoxin domain-containing protein, partial [Pseudomonadota bacterium]
MSESIKVAVVYYSNFKGATEQLAKAIARGAESVAGTQVFLIPVEAVDQHWTTLHGADAIVFGTPTYIGS